MNFKKINILVIIANILSQTLYMLRDKISMQTRTNVLNAIKTRVIKPMDLHLARNQTILQKHWWKDAPENLNVVCWGGVARIALTTISDPVKRYNYVTAALIGAKYSWDAWRKDGFMSEGTNFGFTI